MTHPAALLQRLASDALRARGEPASASDVAAVLGEAPNAWRRWVRGEVAPSAPRVAAWVAALDRAGIDAGLTIDAAGWAVRASP